MDLLRRSFRRGSLRRRPPREPLAESPSFESPSSPAPLQERTIPQLPTSPMDRLRRSFRRNFRRSFGEAADADESTSVMERLRCSFRRSFRRKESSAAADANPLPCTPPVADKLGQSFRRVKDEQPAQPYRKPESATLDKLRRSFRRSLRRQKKEPHAVVGTATASSSSSGLHYWQSDEMDVRAGTCFFNVKYLGCVEVFEPRGILMCEEAFKILKKSRKRPVKSILFVSVNGLRVVEKNSRGLIVDQSIDMLSFCGPVRLHDRGFSFICLNVATLKWMCYCFIAKESGERLSNAVGCAFAIYFERKKKCDKECRVTMNFDLSSSTFTRIGSFKRQSMTESLRGKTNTICDNDKSTSAGGANGSLVPTTIININNNINADFDENKENIPCHRPVDRMRTAYDFERSLHSVSASLRRQRSFRELPRPASHNGGSSSSPIFKRQASLRLRELPSNIERVKSLSAEFGFDARTQFSRYHTPISPIIEVSPANTPDKLNVEDRKTNCFDSAVRQQLSRKFTATGRNSEPSQSNVLQEIVTKNSKLDRQNTEMNMSGCSGHSQHPSVLSSIEGITLTPPATPSPAKFAQLLEPDRRSSSREEALTAAASSANILSTLTAAADSVTNSSSAFAIDAPCRRRAHSLSYAESVLHRTDDPFDIDWSLWTTSLTPYGCEPKREEQQQELPKKKKNTNPFLPNSPDTPEKTGILFSEFDHN